MLSNRMVVLSVAVSLLAACEQQEPLGLDNAVLVEPESLIVDPLNCVGDEVQTDALVDAVNDVREQQAKEFLKPNKKLHKIAQAHACDMALTGRASVAGSDGSSIVDRARRGGYPPCGVIQMVSVGGQPYGLVEAGMRSPPHREQLLGDLSDAIGAGVATSPDGRRWWSLVIGDSCPRPTEDD